MKSRRPSSVLQALAAIVLFAAAAGAQPAGPAAEDDAGNVFPRSKGGPPTAPPTGGPLDTLEVRGVSRDEKNQTMVILFDTANSRCFVANVNETVNGVRIVSYDAAEKASAVVVEAGGKSRRIPIKEASIVPVAVAVPPPQVAVAGGPPVPPGGPPGAAGAMSDQEVRDRMARVAEEIRRRRAMRREMMENAQPPPPPPTGQPTQ